MRLPTVKNPTNALALVAALCAVGPALAQGPVRVIPNHHRDAFGGSPYGYAGGGFRYQLWIRGDNVPVGTVIRELSLVQDQNSASPAGSEDLTIRLTNTVHDFVAIGSDMDANLGTTAPTVFSGTNPLTSRGPATEPNQPVGWIRFTRPFTFTGPHLLLDWTSTNQNITTGGSIDGWNQSQPSESRDVGPGCGSGRLLVGYANGQVALTMLNAPAGNVNFLVGVENYASNGVSYPFDLGPLGMPGCLLGFDPLIDIPVAWAPITRHTFPATIPGNSAVLFVQGVHTTTANPAGYATTNTRTLVLGNAGSIRDVFASDASSSTADSGWPRAFNSGVTMLIR